MFRVKICEGVVKLVADKSKVIYDPLNNKEVKSILVNEKEENLYKEFKK